jgi:hypothetical protein
MEQLLRPQIKEKLSPHDYMDVGGRATQEQLPRGHRAHRGKKQ